MKNGIQWGTFAVFLFICSGSADAQTCPRDILYLKNGSIIKGAVIQFIPDSIVKIQTADGSLFVYPSTEVYKIQKEEIPAAVQAAPDSVSSRKGDGEIIGSLFGGVCIPGGDFNGVATTGFVVGIQIHSKKKIGILVNLSYSSNPSPLEEGWDSFIGVIGLKISLNKETSDFDAYLAPLFGVCLQRLPQNDISGTSAAYGAMIGVQASKRVGFSIRFIAAKPQYKIYGYSAELSSSLVQLGIHVCL